MNFMAVDITSFRDVGRAVVAGACLCKSNE
jgi:hypothetical protein